MWHNIVPLVPGKNPTQTTPMGKILWSSAKADSLKNDNSLRGGTPLTCCLLT